MVSLPPLGLDASFGLLDRRSSGKLNALAKGWIVLTRDIINDIVILMILNTLVVMLMDMDISETLKSFKYRPNALVIRKIAGDDGKEKIQIRVSLGILQMEVQGRPDGKTPHSAESMLEYYSLLIQESREQDGTAEGFMLLPEEMDALDDELMQYYHRRTCFFALGDYDHARKDAEHNLELMDIIRQHCRDKDYIDSHERFRPFVLMERARAIVLKSMNMKDYAAAMQDIGSAIDAIENFYRESGISEERIQKSQELAMLKNWRSQIHQEWEGGVTEIDEGSD